MGGSTKFESVFIKLFGVSPVSDSGMDIMIILVVVGEEKLFVAKTMRFKNTY